MAKLRQQTGDADDEYWALVGVFHSGWILRRPETSCSTLASYMPATSRRRSWKRCGAAGLRRRAVPDGMEAEERGAAAHRVQVRAEAVRVLHGESGAGERAGVLCWLPVGPE